MISKEIMTPLPLAISLTRPTLVKLIEFSKDLCNEESEDEGYKMVPLYLPMASS